MFDAFLLDGLDESFHKSRRVGRAHSRFLDIDTGSYEGCIERSREFVIPIVHQNIGAQFRGFRLPEKGRSLFFHPGTVRVVRRRRDNDPASTNVQKDQHKQIPKSFRCKHSFGEEVALPKCAGMSPVGMLGKQ